jgi:hypothetical protein
MDTSPYPVRFCVTYPARLLDRATTFFRLIVALPILVLLGTVSAGTWSWTSAPGETSHAVVDLMPGSCIALCIVFDPETGMPHAMLGMVDTFTVGGGEPAAATPAW